MTLIVTVLDDAVFTHAFGDHYRDHRAKDRLGRVVAGLSLVRNCETHSPVLAEQLLVPDRVIGVPLSGGGQLFRAMYRWSEYDLLSEDYREITGPGTPSQRRARGDAQDGYRRGVQARYVIETFLDALAFFEALDPRLAGTPCPEAPWDVFVTDATVIDDQLNSSPTSVEVTILAKPTAFDVYEPFLADLACRPTERRSASWPAADLHLKARRSRARSVPPAADMRVITHAIRFDGKTVGFAGLARTVGGAFAQTWVERYAQVRRDIIGGFSYTVADGQAEFPVSADGQRLWSISMDRERDLLESLPGEPTGPFSADRLRMVEEHLDLYFGMRDDS